MLFFRQIFFLCVWEHTEQKQVIFKNQKERATTSKRNLIRLRCLLLSNTLSGQLYEKAGSFLTHLGVLKTNQVVHSP